MGETASNKGYRPTCATTEWLIGWVLQCFWKNQTSWFRFIKDADILFNISDDGSFGVDFFNTTV